MRGQLVLKKSSRGLWRFLIHQVQIAVADRPVPPIPGLKPRKDLLLRPTLDRYAPKARKRSPLRVVEIFRIRGLPRRKRTFSSDLLRRASGRRTRPHLHGAGAIRCKVDPLAIVRPT